MLMLTASSDLGGTLTSVAPGGSMIILNLSSAGRGDSFPFLTAVRQTLLAVVRGGPFDARTPHTSAAQRSSPPQHFERPPSPSSVLFHPLSISIYLSLSLSPSLFILSAISSYSPQPLTRQLFLSTSFSLSVVVGLRSGISLDAISLKDISSRERSTQVTEPRLVERRSPSSGSGGSVDASGRLPPPASTRASSTIMPSFFAPSLHGLPPTPPHVNNGDQPYYLTGPSAFPPRYTQSGCEFIEQYSQSTCYAKQASLNMHGHSMHPMRSGRDMASTQSTMVPHGMQQAMYGPVAAGSMLPPLRTDVQLPPVDSAIPPQYRQQDMFIRPEQQHPKDEKATGGVAAYLDYEMDQMSDFVAEMAQGIVYPGTPVPPQFRKYVYQILSSTRLPSSTILLGLFYLASRMRMLSAAGVYATGSGQVYRMLTTALLLGSKFLDDNTFQNRSWSEVSNIPVSELNKTELEWLFAFEWKIHERIHNKQDGFATWLSHWETWRAKAAVRACETRHKLAPIDTNIPRQHAVSKPLMSPEGPIPPQYQRSAHMDTTWLNPAASEYSPPSAPHSGPNTPDYYSLGAWAYANPPPPYSRAWIPQSQYMAQAGPRSQPPSYHHTPAYSIPLTHSVWTGHGSSCGCVYCMKHHENYMCTNAFGAMQPVVAG
ncbi:hypothetical protein DTO169E5_7806 [Paecilomyces variotii]|nr:hypothetical protein DTO169E5_7806 [Paecilomyces variotii]KAJ9287143.1 hypothetical protein DTO021C3_5279 [Paecilomyces variotii]